MQIDDQQGRRRFLAWVGVLSGLLLVVAAAWASHEPYLGDVARFTPGDANVDERVDSYDTELLRRELAGLEPSPNSRDRISQLCLTGLTRTGQASCWDSAGREIPCAGTGQDADVVAGAHRNYQDNGDGTITDLSTGLVWEKLSLDGNLLHDVTDVFTWNDAFGKIATLNGGIGFAGHTDWRLPNAKELYSIVDLEFGLSAIRQAFSFPCDPGCSVIDCSCSSRDDYWSSSTAPVERLDDPSFAFAVDREGELLILFKSQPRSVRAVRGP